MSSTSSVVTMMLLAVGCTPHAPDITPLLTPAPRSGWMQFATPEEAGFASTGLAKAYGYADSVQSGAVMVIYRGSVVAAWGDVTRKLELHSVRKSIVSALFGIAAERGEISLDRTLGDLGISDRNALTPVELQARVRDLLAARSGVYLPAAYADVSQDDERPARGSHPPNTFWFYNNWDFNTLGTIYEQNVAKSLYASLEERLARPIGMEDYSPRDGFLVYEPSNSIHPAHTIRMSTRDLARFGQLYLQNGLWAGRQIVPRAWVEESAKAISSTGAPGRGYGYLWWSMEPGKGPSEVYPELNRHRVFYGSGTGGQLVAVFPSLDLVIVHRGDTDHGRKVAGRDAWHIVELILAARNGNVAPQTSRVPLTPKALTSQLPAVAPPNYLTLDAESVARLVGEYEVNPKLTIRVFEYQQRLFANFPGRGEGEIFAQTPDDFTIRVEPGARIHFERDASGRATALEAQLGLQRVRGTKRNAQ